MDTEISLTEIVDTSWLEFALYTVEERAIPSIMDGLKISQRFILYSALKGAKDKFTKVAEIGGNVSSYGYHHAESAVQEAATLMTAEWRNNTPILEGDGNFGTRLVQEASAPRYIFAKVHKNYYNIFTDNDICPPHHDGDVLIPKFYLPLIPFVLLNGVEGIATGFKTDIFPYDIKDVTKLVKDYISGKNIDNRELIPKLPQFKGQLVRTGPKSFDMLGAYEMKGKTKLVINDVPYQYDREKYVKILDTLEEEEKIVSYTDDCDGDGFKFTVTLKRDFDADIEKMFKLRSSMTELINVLTPEGKLKSYETPIELIKDFCNYRMKFVGIRIRKEISELTTTMALIKAKIKFIELVLKNKIVFKEKTKAQLASDLIALKFDKGHVDSLLSMNFYHLTTDEIEKLSDRYLELNDRLEYCKETTAQKEYLLDIDNLIKAIK